MSGYNWVRECLWITADKELKGQVWNSIILALVKNSGTANITRLVTVL